MRLRHSTSASATKGSRTAGPLRLSRAAAGRRPRRHRHDPRVRRRRRSGIRTTTARIGGTTSSRFRRRGSSSCRTSTTQPGARRVRRRSPRQHSARARLRRLCDERRGPRSAGRSGGEAAALRRIDQPVARLRAHGDFGEPVDRRRHADRTGDAAVRRPSRCHFDPAGGRGGHAHGGRRDARARTARHRALPCAGFSIERLRSIVKTGIEGWSEAMKRLMFMCHVVVRGWLFRTACRGAGARPVRPTVAVAKTSARTCRRR